MIGGLKVNSELIWNGGIVLIGVFFLIRLLWDNVKLKKVKKDIDESYKKTKTEIKKATKSGINTQSVVNGHWDFDKIDGIRKDYNEISATVNIYIQLISLFPMMGLLGTVFGIKGYIDVMVGDPNNVTQLGLALTTTITGLICAMILKLYATSQPMKQMELIEDNLYEVDRDYNQLIGRGQIEDMLEEE